MTTLSSTGHSGLTGRWPSALALVAGVIAAAVTSSTALSAHAAGPAVTAKQRSAAQQVASSGVALSDLAQGAPDVYTIKRGDTLWDLSKMYLKSPWRWPDLWGMNMDQVRNPHLIYPGQVLVLDKSSGRARLALGQKAGAANAPGAGDTVRLAPGVRTSAAVDPITSVSMHLIAPFLAEMAVFNADELQKAPRIVSASEDRVMMGRGDNAYVLGDVGQSRDWQVFRQATPLTDPQTNEVLGYESRLLGSAQFVREGQPATKTTPHVVPATFVMTNARSEVRAGDRLLPQPSADLTTYAPRAPSKAMTGQIVSVYGDGLVAGQNQIVALNRGSSQGMERGHVLQVLRDGRTLTDRTAADGKPVLVKVPDESHGHMMVFRVFDRVSYALLLKTEFPVRAGDHFGNP
jgi:LysM repeat protein